MRLLPVLSACAFATLLVGSRSSAETTAPAPAPAPAEKSATTPAPASSSPGGDAAATTPAATVTSSPTSAPTPTPPAPSSPAAQAKVVAVSGFASNPAAQAQAPAIESLVGGHLAQATGLKVITQADLQTLISVERQKELIGATNKGSCDEGCMTELAGAVGAQYVVSGRADRFGDTYVLAADVFDAHSAKVLSKARTEAKNEAGIPDAAAELSTQILTALGVAAPAPSSGGPSIATEQNGVPHRFSLGLHVGNAFLASIANLNLSGDFEFGWQFHPSWVAFLQVGATLVRPQNSLIPDQFGLVPSVIGVRRLFRIDTPFQPYVGLGLGVQLSVGNFGLGKAIPLPSALGMVGFQYVFAERFSLGLEASINVAQVFLGVTQLGEGSGFNFDLNGTVAWRF